MLCFLCSFARGGYCYCRPGRLLREEYPDYPSSYPHGYRPVTVVSTTDMLIIDTCTRVPLPFRRRTQSEPPPSTIRQCFVRFRSLREYRRNNTIDRKRPLRVDVVSIASSGEIKTKKRGRKARRERAKKRIEAQYSSTSSTRSDDRFNIISFPPLNPTSSIFDDQYLALDFSQIYATKSTSNIAELHLELASESSTTSMEGVRDVKNVPVVGRLQLESNTTAEDDGLPDWQNNISYAKDMEQYARRPSLFRDPFEEEERKSRTEMWVESTSPGPLESDDELEAHRQAVLQLVTSPTTEYPIARSDPPLIPQVTVEQCSEDSGSYRLNNSLNDGEDEEISKVQTTMIQINGELLDDDNKNRMERMDSLQTEDHKSEMSEASMVSSELDKSSLVKYKKFRSNLAKATEHSGDEVDLQAEDRFWNYRYNKTPEPEIAKSDEEIARELNRLRGHTPTIARVIQFYTADKRPSLTPSCSTIGASPSPEPRSPQFLSSSLNDSAKHLFIQNISRESSPKLSISQELPEETLSDLEREKSPDRPKLERTFSQEIRELLPPAHEIALFHTGQEIVDCPGYFDEEPELRGKLSAKESVYYFPRQIGGLITVGEHPQVLTTTTHVVEIPKNEQDELHVEIPKEENVSDQLIAVDSDDSSPSKEAILHYNSLEESTEFEVPIVLSPYVNQNHFHKIMLGSSILETDVIRASESTTSSVSSSESKKRRQLVVTTTTTTSRTVSSTVIAKTPKIQRNSEEFEETENFEEIQKAMEEPKTSVQRSAEEEIAEAVTESLFPIDVRVSTVTFGDTKEMLEARALTPNSLRSGDSGGSRASFTEVMTEYTELDNISDSDPASIVVEEQMISSEEEEEEFNKSSEFFRLDRISESEEDDDEKGRVENQGAPLPNGNIAVIFNRIEASEERSDVTATTIEEEVEGEYEDSENLEDPTRSEHAEGDSEEEQPEIEIQYSDDVKLEEKLAKESPEEENGIVELEKSPELNEEEHDIKKEIGAVDLEDEQDEKPNESSLEDVNQTTDRSLIENAEVNGENERLVPIEKPHLNELDTKQIGKIPTSENSEGSPVGETKDDNKEDNDDSDASESDVEDSAEADDEEEEGEDDDVEEEEKYNSEEFTNETSSSDAPTRRVETTKVVEEHKDGEKTPRVESRQETKGTSTDDFEDYCISCRQLSSQLISPSNQLIISKSESSSQWEETDLPAKRRREPRDSRGEGSDRKHISNGKHPEMSRLTPIIVEDFDDRESLSPSLSPFNERFGSDIDSSSMEDLLALDTRPCSSGRKSVSFSQMLDVEINSPIVRKKLSPDGFNSRPILKKDDKQRENLRRIMDYAAERLYKDLRMLVEERDRAKHAIEITPSQTPNLTTESCYYQTNYRDKLIENKATLDRRIEEVWTKLRDIGVNGQIAEFVYAVNDSKLLTLNVRRKLVPVKPRNIAVKLEAHNDMQLACEYAQKLALVRAEMINQDTEETVDKDRSITEILERVSRAMGDQKY